MGDVVADLEHFKEFIEGRDPEDRRVARRFAALHATCWVGGTRQG